jgi:hypothetical protein
VLIVSVVTPDVPFDVGGGDVGRAEPEPPRQPTAKNELIASAISQSDLCMSIGLLPGERGSLGLAVTIYHDGVAGGNHRSRAGELRQCA